MFPPFDQVGSLRELEPTLIRNLTDHFGNNLLHIICRHDHDSLLPWIADKFGSHLLSDALNDENNKGHNPVSSAIKVVHRTSQILSRPLHVNCSLCTWKNISLVKVNLVHCAVTQINDQWRHLYNIYNDFIFFQLPVENPRLKRTLIAQVINLQF